MATPPPYTAEEALWKLAQGDARFRNGTAVHPHQRRDEWLAKSLEAKQQHPYAIVLGCADSRVPPEILFDCGFGDLFVIRVAGNVFDSDVFGSIQYAVGHIHVPLVLVLGHERCGAVDAVRKVIKEGKRNEQELAAGPDALDMLIAKIWDVAEATRDDQSDDNWLDQAVRGNVKHVRSQLSEAFAALSAHAIDHEEQQAYAEVKVLAARYDLDTGELEFLADAQPPSPGGSVDRLTVTMVNRSASKIIVYWNNYEGNLRLTTALEPGQQHEELSYADHIFTAHDGFTQVSSYTVTSGGDQVWNIGPA